jgi:REP element-mobilizing transposase RayT
MTLEPTRLRRDLLAMIGQSFRDRLLQQGNRVLAVSVNPTHLHLLCELPDCVSKIKSLIGWCK